MEIRKILVLLVTFCLLLTSGCVSPKDIVLDPSCPVPCWRGISCGMEKDEVMKLVLEMNDMKAEVREDLSSIKLSLRVRPGFWIYITFEDEKVVSFSFGDSKKLLSLEDAIAWYGEPESSVGLFYPGIFTGSEVSLCYTTVGVFFDTGWHEGPNGEVRLDPETHVTSIHYIDMESTLANSAGFVCPEVSNYSIVSDWHGYGIYQTCNPETLDWCGE